MEIRVCVINVCICDLYVLCACFFFFSVYLHRFVPGQCEASWLPLSVSVQGSTDIRILLLVNEFFERHLPGLCISEINQSDSESD
jgi:hypothetical protein